MNYLAELGTGHYSHINGAMIDHLLGTYTILSRWGVEERTAVAGLFHAIYGPQGLASGLVSLQMRKDIQGRIGIDSEKLVYLYCACGDYSLLAMRDGVRDSVDGYLTILPYRISPPISTR